jgi:hypothetical protein
MRHWKFDLYTLQGSVPTDEVPNSFKNELIYMFAVSTSDNIKEHPEILTNLSCNLLSLSEPRSKNCTVNIQVCNRY